jgi:hypothetical protein
MSRFSLDTVEYRGPVEMLSRTHYYNKTPNSCFGNTRFASTFVTSQSRLDLDLASQLVTELGVGLPWHRAAIHYQPRIYELSICFFILFSIFSTSVSLSISCNFLSSGIGIPFFCSKRTSIHIILVISSSVKTLTCNWTSSRRSAILAALFWEVSTRMARIIASRETAVVRREKGNLSNGLTPGIRPVLMTIQVIKINTFANRNI